MTPLYPLWLDWRSSLPLVSIGHWPETIILYPNASVSSCLTLWPLLHLPIAISLTCLSCSVLALRLNAWPPLHTDSETVKIGYWYWRCCNHSIRLVFSPACWASPHLLWCNLVLLYEGALNLVRYCIAWTLPWTLFATSLLYAIDTCWILVPLVTSLCCRLLAPPDLFATPLSPHKTLSLLTLCVLLSRTCLCGCNRWLLLHSIHMLPSMPLAVWISGSS